MSAKATVLGGGIAGLTAAYDLAAAGYQVELLEKEKHLGGLASGFYGEGWEWPLERAYHHLFASDHDILNFAKEIGFDKIFFRTPLTSSLYDSGIYPLDTPKDLLTFPLLSPFERVRTGAVLAGLKLSPFISSIYEQQTLEDFMKQAIGEHAYEVMFGELMRKKYGKYAGNILASFIWTRIKKRTKALGYMEGGFQAFVDHLEAACIAKGVKIRKGEEIGELQGILDRSDVVVSTLPSPVLGKISGGALPADYLARINAGSYQHALTFIIETEKPILQDVYWLSVCTPQIPALVFLQHTNYIDPAHYDGHHLLYVGNYLSADDPLLKMSEDELLRLYLPHLEKLAGRPLQREVVKTYRFAAANAQPIFDKHFLSIKPDFVTPHPKLFIANLDMTYPYDRGTNYAVKLGRDVAKKIQTFCTHPL